MESISAALTAVRSNLRAGSGHGPRSGGPLARAAGDNGTVDTIALSPEALAIIAAQMAGNGTDPVRGGGVSSGPGAPDDPDHGEASDSNVELLARSTLVQSLLDSDEDGEILI